MELMTGGNVVEGLMSKPVHEKAKALQAPLDAAAAMHEVNIIHSLPEECFQ
jgi:hypothetical protein